MRHLLNNRLTLIWKKYETAKSKAIITITVRLKSEIMKYLNVAEKNDAAKNIALYLSNGTSKRREGLSQYNKIYEFETQVIGQRSQMVMTSVSGHLLALEFVTAYKHWQSCNPLSLFDAPVYKHCPENYDKIKRTLEREVRSCQGLIIWTDCDREGENIGFEIIEVCTAIKSNLKIYRAKFSEITAISVKRALNNLEQPNKNISDAVDVRQELDLRIGAAFTRFQTLRLQKVFPAKLLNSLVSYGSCQFPTLGFVVERYRAVENFVAETFWKIKVNHTMNNLSVDFTWDRVRLFDQEACQILHDICLENTLAKVNDVKTKPKSKWRPLPLDTVELEKLASRKLRINAKETMRIAEKLYTQGFISYPRTETNEFPKEMNLGQLVELHTGDPNWGSFAQNILDTGGPTPRQGNKSDKAHPPIHPTKYTNNLSGNEQRLYEFIVRSFLACCSKDAQGQETTVTIDIANETFSASGLMITARNYLDVYPYDKWSSKEIHVYENGQTFNPTSIDMVEGNTSPPNLLTEADLIALMEKHGIGTDATHAEHIETIKNRSYVALADAIHFVPGLLGMGLVEGYDAMGLNISKPHLRAQLEADLKAISEGRKDPKQVLAEQVARYKEIYTIVTAEANRIDGALAERFGEQAAEYTPTVENIPAMAPVLKCPKCNSDMVIRQKKNNADEFYISCVSYPRCKNAIWLPSIVKTLQVLPDHCTYCGPNYKKIKFEWRNNSMSHIYPPPYTACVGGCDTTFLEYLQINISTVRNTPATRTNSTDSQNSTNRIQSSIANNNTTNSINECVPPMRSGRPQQFVPPATVNRAPNAADGSNISVSRSTVNRAPSVSVGPTMPIPRGAFNTSRMPTQSSSDDSEENNVLCACNKTAILLTVRKQNLNFDVSVKENIVMKTCISRIPEICKIYQPAVEQRGGLSSISLSPMREEAYAQQWDIQQGGKKFYKCQAGKENGGCDFFLWAPESSDNAQINFESPSDSSWGSSNNSTHGWGVASTFSRDDFPPNEDNVVCNCGVPCKKIIVQKNGPNKGRPFYGCPKEYNARCKFFQWADEETTAERHVQGSFRGGSRGRGRGRGAGGAVAEGRPRARKCGLCQQEGHTRNRCPNNQ